MTRYLVRRFLQGLLTLFLLMTAVFFFAQALLPGDFASRYAMGASPAQIAAIRRALGLDQPVTQQYLHWLGGILRGDLGNSFSGPPVLGSILSTLPNTLLVFVTGLSIAFVLGQWLGRVTAWKGPGLLSDSSTFVAIAFYAFFPPSLAFIGEYFFGRLWGLVPYPLSLYPQVFKMEFGYFPSLIMGRMVLTLGGVGLAVLLIALGVRRITRRRVPALLALLAIAAGWAATWQAMGFFGPALEVMRAAALPILIFVLISFGEITVIMRTSMMDTIGEEYVVTARAKGLRDRDVRDHHAGRNAIIPVLSRFVISMPYLLTGLVIIEYALGWNGMGSGLFNAVGYQDMPLTMGYLLFVGLLALAARLVLETLYASLDPRIRYGNDRAGGPL